MSEFGLIEYIRSLFDNLSRNGFEGVRDDCAILPISSDEALVFTSDMLNEGIHFLPNRVSARDIAYKSLMVNISDVAAMGATPVATLLSIALPKERSEAWAKEFIDGYREISSQYNVALVGGDTTASQSGIVISITAIGRVPLTNIKRRGDAKVGDRVLVGGLLGASAAGLRDILRDDCDTEFALEHRLPRAQVVEGEWLGRERDVRAMMDISDGIASDLRHILKASNVGAVIDLDKIPTKTTLEDAVCGGEDYKLLLTVNADNAADIITRCFDATRTRLYDIGEIVEGDSIEWRREGDRVETSWRGFEHF